MHGRNFGALAAMCLVALFFGSANAVEKSVPRMVSNHIIPIHAARYTVQLRESNFLFCGGTLVHPQFVVTAAHCFNKVDYRRVIVVGGANTRADVGIQRRIMAMQRYPWYTKQTKNGDVAILKLDHPMPINNFIGTVDLCSAPVPANHLITVTGWGRLWEDGARSNELRSIEVPIMNLEECQAKYTSDIPITHLMMCAYPSYTVDACQGDSGGPAIYRGELCGIVSFGQGCADGAPGMYTNVYELRGFILEAMRMM